MKSWIINNKLLIVGIILGALGGYFYWQQIGCSSGTCAITSKWHNSTVYGALMGGLLFSMFKKKNMSTNSKKETFGEIIKGSTPVLVDFTAEWCGPCKMMKPVLEELFQRKGEKLRILKIDIDKSPAAANAFDVQSVPTLILFQNGKQLWRQSGVMQAASLERIIDQLTTKN